MNKTNRQASHQLIDRRWKRVVKLILNGEPVTSAITKSKIGRTTYYDHLNRLKSQSGLG